MIRSLVHALGFVLVAAAFAALVVDGTRSIAGGRLLLYSFGETAAWLGGARYAALAGGLTHLPVAAQQVSSAVLAVPGWVVAGGIGSLLLRMGRPPAAGVGFSGRRT